MMMDSKDSDCVEGVVVANLWYHGVKLHYAMKLSIVWRGTPEGPSVQKFANLAEARGSGGLEIVFNQQ